MYTIYQVMNGDTLETLAYKFNTDIETLRRINSLPFNYDLTIGEQIIVPANNEEPFIYYTIQKGDNLYEISRRYNVDLNTLLRINGLNKDDYIYPKEQIIIPKGNITTYIIEENETLKDVSNKLNTSIDKILTDNENIYLLPNQLIIIKK